MHHVGSYHIGDMPSWLWPWLCLDHGWPGGFLLQHQTTITSDRAGRHDMYALRRLLTDCGLFVSPALQRAVLHNIQVRVV
jgi:hypothetical protein